ncbi:MAG: glycoside hydrolase family 88 protein [Clostridia bacterium]|nr:glycoside hydrolase family 88 protein [Clostridia bacterium]
MKRFLAMALTIAILATVIMVPNVQAAEYTAPVYDDVIETIKKVNDYWITSHRNDVGSAFWERGAYNTGNMEAYFLTGIEEYKEYSERWANRNRWTGHPSNSQPNEWTWGYSHDTNSKAVLFGDWQTCFQTYADLYNLDEIKSESKMERATYVMEYQMSKSEDEFWWWADALYMVMPTMVKLYNTTGNELYLDKLYEYYNYARELMYDGPDGIPTSEAGYESTARLNNGAQFSDENDYKYLFFRDARYVYPLNPIPGNETTKNFWARGNGWVFAALAKVLQETPDNWEYRQEFMDAYLGMAKTLKEFQKFDDKGNGFWTQSILAHNYSCDPGYNPYGYETSGTAFFTYGFLWGINSGVLDEAEYLNTALAGWKYLTEIAIQPNGKVGYVQWVGGEAGKAAVYDNTQDFAVGATLLAGCEMAKYVGGMQGYFYPYLQRRMVNMVGLKVDAPYAFTGSNVKPIDAAPVIVNDRTLVPVRVISEGLGATVEWDGTTQAVTITLGDKMIVMNIGSYVYKDIDVIERDGDKVTNAVSADKTLDAAPMLINDRTMVPLRAIAEALGKTVYYNDAYKLIIVGYKNEVFQKSEKAMEEMLANTLATGVRPEKNPYYANLLQTPAELTDSKIIRAVSATATAEPENFNAIYMSIDGDPSSRWGSDREATLIVDFGTVQYMEKLCLSIWRGNSGQRSTKFDLYTSVDGVNYEPLYSGESLNTTEFNILDCGKEVRYVKFHGYHNSENNWVNVFEVVGYGEGTQVATNLK